MKASDPPSPPQVALWTNQSALVEPYGDPETRQGLIRSKPPFISNPKQVEISEPSNCVNYTGSLIKEVTDRRVYKLRPYGRHPERSVLRFHTNRMQIEEP